MSDGKQAPQNIQDAFLNTVRREKTTVIVYLLNGAKLTGRIRSFDKFSVLLESGSQEQLIFKRIRRELPAMAEYHRLSAAPVLVVDLRAVLGGDHAHLLLSFPADRWWLRPPRNPSQNLDHVASFELHKIHARARGAGRIRERPRRRSGRPARGRWRGR